jgi:ribonuclease HI
MKVTVHIDGGSRGNPGPAGAGVVIRSADDDHTILHEAGLFLGRMTNNQAEYHGLLAALVAAGKLGARQVQVFSDSELLVRQMQGEYRVKNEGLRPLYEKACRHIRAFESCQFQHIRRENNAEADRLANRAMDAKANVEDAAE